MHKDSENMIIFGLVLSPLFALTGGVLAFIVWIIVMFIIAIIIETNIVAPDSYGGSLILTDEEIKNYKFKSRIYKDMIRKYGDTSKTQEDKYEDIIADNVEYGVELILKANKRKYSYSRDYQYVFSHFSLPENYMLTTSKTLPVLAKNIGKANYEDDIPWGHTVDQDGNDWSVVHIFATSEFFM